jgi:hypothetical protein
LIINLITYIFFYCFWYEGTNLDKAENDLKKELDKIKFGENVEEPELTRSSMDAFPIVFGPPQLFEVLVITDY